MSVHLILEAGALVLATLLLDLGVALAADLHIDRVTEERERATSCVVGYYIALSKGLV